MRKKSVHKKVISGFSDLIADVKNEKVDLTVLKDSELPKILIFNNIK